MDKNKKEMKLYNLYRKYGSVHIKEELVYGDGNPDSGYVMIGEAPAKDEVLQGKPFVGLAGGNLKIFMDYIGWSREDIYVTNAIKYRLYKTNGKTGRKSNRPAKIKEIKDSRDCLLREMEILEPILIVTLGNVPLKAITGDFSLSIGNVHGNVLIGCGYRVFPLYHPASLIYNRALIEVYYEDLEELKKVVKEEETCR